MDPALQLRQALQAPRAPEELMRTLQGLAASGMTQADAYAALRGLLDEAGFAWGDEQTVTLRAALDVVCGWCRPEARLWPGELPRLHHQGEGPQAV